MTDPFSLNGLIERLNGWRNLPGYRLEPRLDAQLAPYLPAFLAGAEVDPRNWHILPEFPVQRALAKNDKDRKSKNRPIHVDYLVVSPSHHVWLVELKTDDSIDLNQLRYLLRLSAATVGELLGSVRKLSEKTRSPAKYRYLWQQLQVSGLAMDGAAAGPLATSRPQVVYLAPSWVIERARTKVYQLALHIRKSRPEDIAWRSLKELVEQEQVPLSPGLRALLSACEYPSAAEA